MSDEKRILVTFGRSDPLHLTEATIVQLGMSGTPIEHIGMVWGPDFNRPLPDKIGPLRTYMGRTSLRKLYTLYDVVYCGHGATLLEATAAGCEVMVLWNVATDIPRDRLSVVFVPAWTDVHLDHSGREVRWWEPGVMETMSREIRERRFHGLRRGVEAPTTSRGAETGLEGDLPPGGASWVHQAWAPR